MEQNPAPAEQITLVNCPNCGNDERLKFDFKQTPVAISCPACGLQFSEGTQALSSTKVGTSRTIQ